jgi:hypothetical protein
VELVRTIDPFRVTVNGDTVEVDQRTFTLAERRASRAALLAQSNGDHLAPDETDAVAALVWTVLRRSDETLTLDDVCASLTVGDLAGAETIKADDLSNQDDDPEA